MSSSAHDVSRGACDRCHGQKLQCKPGRSNEGCLRCQKAGVRCLPRPSRSSRHRTRSHATQRASMHSNPTQNVGSALTLLKENLATEQNSQAVSEYLGLSPISLLDAPSDLDLGLNFPSLQSELGPPPGTRDFQPNMDIYTMQSHKSGQSFAQAPPQSRSGGQREQENHTDLPGASQGSYRLTSPTFNMLPLYSEEPSAPSKQPLSLPRNITPQSLTYQSQETANPHLMDFDQLEGDTLNIDSERSGSDFGYRPTASRRPQSIHGEFQSSYNDRPYNDRPYNDRQQTTNLAVEPTVKSWIRKLSDINVELHQHMLSIPCIEAERGIWTDTKDKTMGNGLSSTRNVPELAVDCTFRLSHQYMETIRDMSSRIRTGQAHHVPVTAALTLDQPSRLLILSSYLCLIESYDRVMQHIKSWTEVRLNMGASSSAYHFPIQLPNIAIGTFEFFTCSSTQPLIMMCILRTMIKQIHDLVDGIMKPANALDNGTATMLNAPAGEQGSSDGCDGLSGVVKVTLQAIRAKEDSTIKLIDVTWKLALRCGIT
ncbi:uncharacterized protein BCR38DRAFT_382710 [Pseudomassariella vexata]|uniref:Zn(2)-C6 fungal-type domain-containing protein n=1 Tax=Pseudomassariella vexata TaxID=1141098 RepID=A0A1Y2EJQ8_9PEZI|nr:uncharacterized protein BCR38DRAFT_382710 [Pseudomassariella vexata]ORY71788.1 hypothetical protein BCR38DRAFT_382710 [Pseudomassariella vexata]